MKHGDCDDCDDYDDDSRSQVSRTPTGDCAYCGGVIVTSLCCFLPHKTQTVILQSVFSWRFILFLTTWLATCVLAWCNPHGQTGLDWDRAIMVTATIMAAGAMTYAFVWCIDGAYLNKRSSHESSGKRWVMIVTMILLSYSIRWGLYSWYSDDEVDNTSAYLLLITLSMVGFLYRESRKPVPSHERFFKMLKRFGLYWSFGVVIVLGTIVRCLGNLGDDLQSHWGTCGAYDYLTGNIFYYAIFGVVVVLLLIGLISFLHMCVCAGEKVWWVFGSVEQQEIQSQTGEKTRTKSEYQIFGNYGDLQGLAICSSSGLFLTVADLYFSRLGEGLSLEKGDLNDTLAVILIPLASIVVLIFLFGREMKSSNRVLGGMLWQVVFSVFFRYGHYIDREWNWHNAKHLVILILPILLAICQYVCRERRHPREKLSEMHLTGVRRPNYWLRGGSDTLIHGLASRADSSTASIPDNNDGLFTHFADD